MKQKIQSTQPVENPEQIEYREALKILNDAELKIILRNNGVDPYKVSQKEIDDISRLINKIHQIESSTKAKMNTIQQEGQQEQASINQELITLIKKIQAEQNPSMVTQATAGMPEQPAQAVADQPLPAVEKPEEKTQVVI